MVEMGSVEPDAASSHLSAGDVHSTMHSLGVSRHASFWPQHGHVVTCSGVLGSPGALRKASCRVKGVAAAPTQSPIPTGALPNFGTPPAFAAPRRRNSSHARIIAA